MSEPGQLVLGGRFRLVRPLGEGGMGVVWEAEDVATRARQAIKFLKDDDRSDRSVRRFRREAQAASAIAHTNIVRVFEVAEEPDGSAAIVMELLDGESLGARLEREGTLSLGQAAAILGRVASALRAAHAAGIVHRDLKPDNVFLTIEPDGSVGVRVLDFGIAKHYGLPADSLTVTGTIMGTPLYMSPEQASGERGLDPRTDVWSIAVLAFECLTGTLPVCGENYGQLLARLIRGEIRRLSYVAPALPPDVLAVVDGALVTREQRPSDLAELEAVFARHADAEIQPTPSRPAGDGSLPVLSRTHDANVETQALALEAPAARRGGLLLLVALAVVTIGGGGVGFALFAGSRAPRAVDPPSGAPARAPVVEPAPPEISAEPPPSESGSAATPASASAEPPASVATPRPRPPAPRSSAAAAPPAAAAPSSGGHGPTRLQGGVAGDVPF